MRTREDCNENPLSKHYVAHSFVNHAVDSLTCTMHFIVFLDSLSSQQIRSSIFEEMKNKVSLYTYLEEMTV